MPFYVYAWIASIVYGLWAITAKLTGKYQLKNAWQFSFFALFFEAIFILVTSLIKGASIPTNWTFIILAAAFMTLGSALFLFALKKIDVSVMSPLFNIRVVITVMLGVLFLGEVVTSRSFWLIAMVVVAGFFATMDEKFSIKSFFTRSVGLALLYMFSLSLRTLFINRAIATNDYWTVNLWMLLLATIFAGFLFYPRFKKDLAITKLKDYRGVALMATLGGLGELAANKAFEGNVGISSVIISLPISMVLAFLFSVFKPELLEKHTTKVYAVRFTAAAIMIWGALQLSKWGV